MTKHYQHIFAGSMMALGLLWLSACSESKHDVDVPDDKESIQLDFTRVGEDGSSKPLEDVDVYVFSGESLVQSIKNGNPDGKPVSIDMIGQGVVLATSGYPLEVEKGATLDDVLGMTISMGTRSSSLNPAEIYSGIGKVSETTGNKGKLTLDMVRVGARIDMVNEADDKVFVNEVKIENAPEKTFVFKGEKAFEGNTVGLGRTFTEPFQGREEGIFTVFESQKPISVRIRGTYGDIPMDMTTELPSIERNKVYTLQVVNVGSKIETTFQVKDWEAGATVGAGADTSKGIFIDPDFSVIPEGVKVDYGKNIVIVPYTGAEGIKLAFKNDSKIVLSSADGVTEGAKVKENKTETVGDGYVSSVSVGINPQGKGRLGYSLFLHFRNAMMSQSYDFVEIRVDPSPYQIETVKIGGHEWMCFNATSSDLNDQIYILDGIDTVEDMYKERFAESVGNFFQYGRAEGYSPWSSNDPNANPLPEGDDRANHIPWSTPGYMPLPEGYHVASFAEWEDLIPAGTTIPSEYTCKSGEKIRASVVTLPGTLTTPNANVNKQNFKMRYVEFESLDTGNKLFVPICSNKSNSQNDVPGYNNRYENRVTYWVSNDRGVWLIDWKDVDGKDGAQLSESKWNYDGFCPVRGIKD